MKISAVLLELADKNGFACNVLGCFAFNVLGDRATCAAR
jgi:hypothetical protein